MNASAGEDGSDDSQPQPSDSSVSSIPRRLAETAYNGTLRHFLPRKIGVYNGVAIREPRLLDAVDHYPVKKQGLVDGIEELVGPDDHVVEIGAGRGVATVHAARRAAAVVAYEAAASQVDRVRETLGLNDCADVVDLRHGLVGPDVDVWGDATDAPVVEPDDLPECDVLVTDCEGAELEILEELSARPRGLVVECHDCFGTPTDDVVALLEDRGYAILDRSLHDPTAVAEVYVVTAERRD